MEIGKRRVDLRNSPIRTGYLMGVISELCFREDTKGVLTTSIRSADLIVVFGPAILAEASYCEEQTQAGDQEAHGESESEEIV